MPMERIYRSDAITKAEFHARLKEWLATGESQISDETYGQTAWIHIQDNGEIYYLNADTKREGVEEYLALVDPNQWSIVENQRGTENKVAFGTEEEPIPHFYLYKITD